LAALFERLKAFEKNAGGIFLGFERLKRLYALAEGGLCFVASQLA
jgi:hypothetical protein